MLSIAYREAGQTEQKVIVVEKLTYSGPDGEFALHDEDDIIQVFIKPVRLVVKSIVSAPDN